MREAAECRQSRFGRVGRDGGAHPQSELSLSNDFA
jgi:hypothetical protein